MKESNIQKEIHLALSKLGSKIFRNNVAKCWIGKSKTIHDGSVVIEHPRRLNAGLCVGSSDLIGWTSVEVTPEMVGKKIAVFTAVEVKTPTGRLSQDQKQFLDNVQESGGLSLVARSPAQAEELIRSQLDSWSTGIQKLFPRKKNK